MSRRKYSFGNPSESDLIPQGGNALEGIYKAKEVNNPEKIYATLQECRDTVGIKKTEVCKKSGFVYKRNEKNKKWKNMFFVLQMDGTDTHLLMFESPKVCAIMDLQNF